jgi:putative MATE family efflux protein
MDSFYCYIKLIRVSLPVVITTIAIYSTNLITLSISGKYSIEAMAAVSVFFSINILVYNVFLSSFSGYRTLSSKAFGNNDLRLVNSLFNNNIIVTLSVSLVIILILTLYARNIVRLVTYEPIVIDISKALLEIGAWSYPFAAITFTLNVSLASQKRTDINMFLILGTSIFGIIANLFFVYGFERFPGLGILGIAWANLLQGVVTCLAYIIIFPKTSVNFFHNTSLSARQCIRLWALSYPTMISMFVDYLSNLILFSMIGTFLGTKALASGRLGVTCSLLIFSFIVAISSGFNILGGRELGKGNTRKFLNYYLCNKRLTIFCALFMSLIILIAPVQILKIFTKFADVQELSYIPLIIAAIAAPLSAWSYNNAVYLRLIEEVKVETICNVLALWLVQIPLAYYLGIVLNWQLNGFFIAFILYDIFYLASTNYFVCKKFVY